MLLSDSYNHRIRTVVRNGTVRTLAGSGKIGNGNGGYVDDADPLQAKFFHPYGIASIVENGRRLIIIGGHWDQRIRVIYANMTVSTLAGSGAIGYMNCVFRDSADPLSAGFCNPAGVAVDSHGNVIVADCWSNRIRKLWRDSSCSGVTTIAGNGPVGSSSGPAINSDRPSEASFITPSNVAIDGAGNIVISCVYEQSLRIVFVNGSVRTFAGGASGAGFVDNAPLLQAFFDGPYGVAIDGEGRVLVADTGNNRVRMACAKLDVEPLPCLSPSFTHTLAATRSRSPPPLPTLTLSRASSLSSSRSASETASVVTTLQTHTATSTSAALNSESQTIPGPGKDPPELAAQKDTAAATTSCALVAATASGGGVELQGAIVLGMMDCSNAYVRKVSDGSSRLVTVLYDQSAAWRVLGNLLVAMAALLVHGLAVVAVRLRGGNSLTIGEAAAKCRFPGLSHRIFVLCLQGLLLESLRGVVRHSDDTSALGASVCGLVVCMCVPALVAVRCSCACREVAYSPYVVALTTFPRWLRTLLLPRGWWLRKDDAARHWGRCSSSRLGRPDRRCSACCRTFGQRR